MIMDYFGLTVDSKTLVKHGYKEEVFTEEELAMDQFERVGATNSSCIGGAAQLHRPG